MLAGFVLWAASGLGAALLVPLVSALMEQLGWQETFWSLGAVGGGLILSLTFLFRGRPADLGLTPYGATTEDPPEGVRSPALERQRRQVFLHRVRRTRAFWDLPLIHGLGCAGHGIVLIYVVPLAVAGPHAGGGLGDSQPHCRHEHREPVPDAQHGGVLGGQTDHGCRPAAPGPHGAGAL